MPSQDRTDVSLGPYDAASAQPAVEHPAFQVEGLSKTFNGNTVLSDARITLRSGEVHALLGHNGSGKSTLIKALAGVHVPDPGSRAWAAGSEVSLEDQSGSWRSGLRFIHQDLGLIPSLSAAENLALVRGYETRRGKINWRRESAKAKSALARFGATFDVNTPVGLLSRSAQSLIAIARAFEGLDDDANPVIALDEPTASLPQREVDILFDAIRLAVSQGAAVMLVSHRLNDVVALADRVTVLRDGRVVAEGEAGRGSKADLVDLLLGGTAAVLEGSRTDGAVDSGVVAEFEGLLGQTLADLHLTVRRGSILGVTGLDGSGREEVAALLHEYGDAGRVRLPGTPASLRRGGLLRRRRNPVALIPADRMGEGLIPSFSVRENLTLPAMDSVVRRGRIRIGREKIDAQGWVRRLDVRPRSTEMRVDELSGGNAQKVLLAKALRQEPRILVADEPTSGVDVGAKAQIYRDLAAVSDTGVGVVVVSSDSEELALVCDTVLVLAHGTLVGELSGSNITEELIHRLAHSA